ncbi:conserved hypothetical protein [Methanosalsum zhilinae DSM 4017]|uniref:VTT domain-containing protein n=1 Tax=Methanosalsum zhilinae (strain DSM 4017 / NBRC 107636 / OCM 62 / WeN5) TaxID=679901 RepID=F7XM04_METZD|nr:VTT domain-containing protein [Methanosalsum zhilinae]AEH60936.1 conserved hypothetical protein [Methanosalsum zhilinae DSM 4017]
MTKECAISRYTSFGRKRSMQIFFIIALFVVLWSIFLHFYPPAQIVAMLGVRNVYIFVFLLAMIGGVSIFTTTLFYTSLITIAFGGVNLIWLSLFASTGLLFGDLIFYYMAKTGSQCVPQKYENIVSRLKEFMYRYSDRTIIFIIFAYSLTPLPSDAISIVLGVSAFPIRKMILPLILGKFLLILLFIEIVFLGYSFF